MSLQKDPKSVYGASKHHRQAHKKSRNGCVQCKTRRRKCDEVHPTCGSCRRHATSCSLNSPISTPATSSSLPNTLGESSLNLADLRLLFHWMKGDGTLFSDHDACTARRDREMQMELALAHPYLLHTILSLAALELFHLDPSTLSLYFQASSHHAAALRHARPNMERSSGGHGEALYLFSAFTSLYAFVEPPLRALAGIEGSSTDLINDLLSAFRMGRGIGAVSDSKETPVREAGLFDDREKWSVEYEDVMPTLDEDFPQLKVLTELAKSSCSELQMPSIIEAVKKLFANISLLHQRSQTHSSAHVIQTWPMHINSCIFDIWEAKLPFGLVLLAHYAAMVSMRQNLWFFGRWPSLLLDALQTILDIEWQEYLNWPKAIISRQSELCNDD